MERNHGYFDKFVHSFWSYYRELEDDFLATRKYVSFDPANYPTYSIEYLKLYQAACSEIDVLGKAMAHAANGDFKQNDGRKGIYNWWFEIQDSYRVSSARGISWTGGLPAVGLPEATCLFLGVTKVRPWNAFRVEKYKDKKGSRRFRSVGDSTPAWWSSYNKVKHNRISLSSRDGEGSNYAMANLGNVINALAALYLLEKTYMETVGTRDDLEAFFDQSRLFVERSFVTTGNIDALFPNRPAASGEARC